MTERARRPGISTLLNAPDHSGAAVQSLVPPIYLSSSFDFPDYQTGVDRLAGDQPGYTYTRIANPNLDRLARRLASLESLPYLEDERTGAPPIEDYSAGDRVRARVFSSGMAAITGAILARARAGDMIVAQRPLFGYTYVFLNEIAPSLGIKVAWVRTPALAGWAEALAAHPEAVLAYLETPVNPTLQLLDIREIAGLAHQQDCLLIVDNTFATPYCQRPLQLGADIVVHSTTKFLSGHGSIVGGAVISGRPGFIDRDLLAVSKVFGAVPSPFDAWLAEQGLRTFELRMARHCDNGQGVAEYLQDHPAVSRAVYPGLSGSDDASLARRQMLRYGGMVSFQLGGGSRAVRRLLESVRVFRLAVSLGTLESLIQHPAAMTHAQVPQQARREMGIDDGLVRLSVGIENLEDLLADLEQGLARL